MYFSNHEPIIDNFNGQSEEPYLKNDLTKFQYDLAINEANIIILARQPKIKVKVAPDTKVIHDHCQVSA